MKGERKHAIPRGTLNRLDLAIKKSQRDPAAQEETAAGVGWGGGRSE